MHCYNDGNLYESIDNLNVKGATADTYEYAYSDASKVDLPDENANKEQVRYFNIFLINYRNLCVHMHCFVYL